MNIRYILSLFLLILVSCSKNYYVFSVSSDFQLTDSNAIIFSRKTLKKSGIKLLNMIPIPYSNKSDKIFARNISHYNSGYVLWHQKGNPRIFEYSVSISYKDGKIYCRVNNAK